VVGWREEGESIRLVNVSEFKETSSSS
jgi:hypothetical protein